MNDEEERPDEEELTRLLSSSGFTIVPIQTIIDALAQMEQYLKDEAGITQEELESYLEKIQELVGEEEAMQLELDEILSWIKAFQGS